MERNRLDDETMLAAEMALPQHHLEEHPRSLEGTRQRVWPNGWWGPKTTGSDSPWYLPESMVGELPYRYQGVVTHGLLSLIPPATAMGLALNALNAAYAVGTHLSGRTAPIKRVGDQLPPVSYPPPMPSFEK